MSDNGTPDPRHAPTAAEREAAELARANVALVRERDELRSEIDYWKREWAKDEMEIGSDAHAIRARAERDAALMRVEKYRRALRNVANFARNNMSAMEFVSGARIRIEVAERERDSADAIIQAIRDEIHLSPGSSIVEEVAYLYNIVKEAARLRNLSEQHRTDYTARANSANGGRHGTETGDYWRGRRDEAGWMHGKLAAALAAIRAALGE